MNLILLESVSQTEYIFVIVMLGIYEGTPYYLSTFQVFACIPSANIPLTKESQVSKTKVTDRKVYSHRHLREGVNIFEQ